LFEPAADLLDIHLLLLHELLLNDADAVEALAIGSRDFPKEHRAIAVVRTAQRVADRELGNDSGCGASSSATASSSSTPRASSVCSGWCQKPSRAIVQPRASIAWI
jgi:hypothetical protein